MGLGLAMRTQGIDSAFLPRRGCLFWLSFMGVTLLGACAQTHVQVSMAEVRRPDPLTKQQVLRELGFSESADGWELDLSGHVTFEVNDSVLSPAAMATLQRIAKALSEVGIHRITVEGHTDSQGGAAYNLLLSRRRAESAARILSAEGFKESELILKWYGYERPVANNATEAGRQQNRRVALIVAAF